MWGLGLFFSVQFTYQYGLIGLLSFAVPNALGLILFGYFVQKVARRPAGNDGLWVFFQKWSRPFRLIFFLYQILALTLTVFAIIRYLFVPLDLPPSGFVWLFLPLTAVIILATGCLFGEEFDIRKIKFSHLVQMLILLGSVGFILVQLRPFGGDAAVLDSPVRDFTFWGYVIPICVGLLVGPWLDLQQWQRAIQMNREKTSIRLGYLVGGGIFFLLLLFHGTLAHWIIHQAPGTFVAHTGIDKLDYAHDLVTQFFHTVYGQGAGHLHLAYFIFIGVCILTTLDSGYLALRWFLTENIKASDNVLLSLVPKNILGSPIPSFIFCGAFALFATVVNLELEYFMVFYASFFVGYAALAIARCFVPNSQNPLPQIRMFSMGSLAVVIFAYGYFLREPSLMIFGSLLPIGYVVWLVFNTDLLRVVTEKAEEVMEAASDLAPIRAIKQHTTHILSEDGNGKPHELASVAGHFEGKWFVHSFVATYSDTNSVGNVYFGMYVMWVGKTRELFFNRAMPGFDLKDTHYYILTRSFEHKFVRETREFETVTVKIRVAEYNRKFVTMEHQIFDSSGQMLGKGKQSLLFVSAKDYALIDIPAEVHTAFMPYV